MSFKCTNCKKEFATKQRLDTHINKKNKCKFIDDKPDEKLSNCEVTRNELVVKPDQNCQNRTTTKNNINKKTIFTCQYCSKTFKWHSSKIRHLKGRCPSKRATVSIIDTDDDSDTSINSSYSNNDPVVIQSDPAMIQFDPVKSCKNEESYIKIKKNDELKCEYCDKKFTLLTNKIRHVKYRCKVKNNIINEQQETIDDLQSIINKKEKKLKKKNKKLKRAYTREELLSKTVNNYNFIMETCKNSYDLMCPKLICSSEKNQITDSDRSYPTLILDRDQVEYYVNLGVKHGIPAMIKKIYVDYVDIISRGAWCTDPTRSRFIFKKDGLFIQDNNGQQVLDIIMPGIEKLFFDDLEYWQKKVENEGYNKSTYSISRLVKRQTFVREMRDKGTRKIVARNIGAPLSFNRNEILDKVEKSDFDNIQIIFDNRSIQSCTVEEID